MNKQAPAVHCSPGLQPGFYGNVPYLPILVKKIIKKICIFERFQPGQDNNLNMFIWVCTAHWRKFP
jgi:hypothetical protein